VISHYDTEYRASCHPVGEKTLGGALDCQAQSDAVSGHLCRHRELSKQDAKLEQEVAEPQSLS